MKAIIDYKCELQSGTVLANNKQPFICGDALAHMLRITVTEGGQPADLSGTAATAYCVLSNRCTATANVTIAGSVLQVTFPASFYAIAGDSYVIVRLAQGSQKVDVLCMRYTILTGTTSTVYDPSGELPSLADFAAAIAAANAAASSVAGAAEEANEKAALAEAKASEAQNAAAQALEKAGVANGAAQTAANAAEAAEAAADAIDAMTASATVLEAGSAATAVIGDMGGHKHITFGIPRGEQGEQGAPYTIKGAAYATLAALTAGVQNPQMGDQYNVGEQPPYNVYRWTGSGWEDQGQIAAGTNTATPEQAGLMSAEDKSKLDGIEAGAVLAPRPNLLDNWYFTNPVNQRGKTEYTATGYTIDRWRNSSTSLKATVVNNGLRITPTGTTYKAFTQRLENVGDILGRTVTVSALMTGLTNLSESDINFRVWASNGSSLHTSYLLTANQKITVGNQVLFVGTATLPETISYSGANVGVSITEDVSANAALTLVACKLEYGSMQTLARQEGGAWVLNEVPDYSAELAKCQRYFYRYLCNDIAVNLVGVMNSTSSYVVFDLPQEMRVTPTITPISGNGSADTIYNPGGQVTVTGYSNPQKRGRNVRVTVNHASASISPGAYLYGRTGRAFDFSADL